MSANQIDQEYIDRIRSGQESLEQILQDLMDDGGDVNFVDSLGPLCEMGGWPNEDGEAEYSVAEASIVRNSVIFTCKVFFDERYHGGGCPDMPSLESRAGEVCYELDLGTGILSATRHPE